MAISRYSFNSIEKDGVAYSTSDRMSIIFNAVENNLINYTTYTLEEQQRLDHIAGMSYRDSSYWWIIAAASGIGWGLQVPPGTLIRIPKDLNEVLGLIS